MSGLVQLVALAGQKNSVRFVCCGNCGTTASRYVGPPLPLGLLVTEINKESQRCLQV